MIRVTTLIAFGLFAFLAVPTAGVSEEVSLSPAKDNTLFESTTGNLSNGEGEFLFAGITGQSANRSARRALLSFDIAGAVPSDATITGATLTLNMSRTISGGTDVSLHRLTQDWGTGTSDAAGREGRGAPATPGDATWLHTFSPDTEWNTAGGDFVDLASDTISVSGNGSYTWGAGGELVADVTSWLQDPAANFGWILIGDESATRTAKRFDSGNHSSASNRPSLNIVFELGALAGDFDGDGELTPADLDVFCAALNEGTEAEEFDVNGDGVVDLADRTAWLQDLNGTSVGDADLDGEVAFADFLALSANFGEEGGWAQGDFDCSGDVVFADFLLLSGNFGVQQGEATLASVPEPSLGLLVIGALLPAALMRKLRRSR